MLSGFEGGGVAMITASDLLVIAVVGIAFIGAIAVLAPMLYRDYKRE